MRRGVESLAKFRTYSYILIVLTFINLLNPWIAKTIHFTRQRMLYSLCMVIITVLLLLTLYIVKYASTVEKGKYKKVIIMYCARIRYYLIGIAILMACQVGVCVFKFDTFLDTFFVINELLLIILILRYLTLLQREQYPDYGKQNVKKPEKVKVKEPAPESDEPKSRVGANKANKAAKKRKKK